MCYRRWSWREGDKHTELLPKYINKSNFLIGNGLYAYKGDNLSQEDLYMKKQKMSFNKDQGYPGALFLRMKVWVVDSVNAQKSKPSQGNMISSNNPNFMKRMAYLTLHKLSMLIWILYIMLFTSALVTTNESSSFRNPYTF